MKIVRHLLLALLWFAMAGGSRAGDAPFAPYTAAVVTLYSYDQAGKATGHSTGFFVTADGLVATTRQPFKNAAKVIAETSDGKKHAVLGIVAADREHDLVIARVEGKDFPFLREGIYKELHGGGQIVTVGDPVFAKGKVTAGKVKEISGLAHNYEYFLTDTSLGDEAAGSPVLDKDYQFVGLLRAQPGDPAHRFVVAVTAIQTLLADATSNPAPPQPVDRLEARRFDELNDDPDLATALHASNMDSNYAEATRLLKQVVHDCPNGHGTVYMLLALTGASVVPAEERTGFLLAAIKQNPDYGQAWGELALTYAFAGRRAEAIEAANRAMLLGIDDAVVLSKAGDAFSQLKMNAEVRKVVELLRALRTPIGDRRAATLESYLE